MTLAFVMRKPGRAGTGAALLVQAVAMAVAMTDAASSLRCMEDVARYAVGKRPGIPISG